MLRRQACTKKVSCGNFNEVRGIEKERRGYEYA